MREGIGRKDLGGRRGGRKSEESGIRQPDLRTSKRPEGDGGGREGGNGRVEEFERYGGRGFERRSGEGMVPWGINTAPTERNTNSNYEYLGLGSKRHRKSLTGFRHPASFAPTATRG